MRQENPVTVGELREAFEDAMRTDRLTFDDEVEAMLKAVGAWCRHNTYAFGACPYLFSGELTDLMRAVGKALLHAHEDLKGRPGA